MSGDFGSLTAAYAHHERGKAPAHRVPRWMIPVPSARSPWPPAA